MTDLQTSNVHTISELDSWKTKVLEWKEKVNQNVQEHNQLKKKIDLFQKTKVIVVDNIIKWGSQKAKSSISRHSTMPLGDPEDNPSDYEMHKRMHGSPQMIHPDDADNIALMTHAQKP